MGSGPLLTASMLEAASPVHSQFAASVARWWADAGVDVIVDEVPTPWLDRGRKRPAPVVVQEVAPAPLVKPTSLEGLITTLNSLPGLDPVVPPNQRIAASGNAESDLMIMVDLPEIGDAEAGHLIGGDAGVLFDAMLKPIGRDRQSCYIAAFCPGRPADGAMPRDLVPLLSDLAKDHVAFVKPKRLWLMGQTVSRALLGANAMPGRARLQNFNHDGVIVEAVASFSPRLLLQNPKRKAAAWADMQVLMRGIEA